MLPFRDRGDPPTDRVHPPDIPPKSSRQAICHSASASAKVHGQVHVFRIGQLCGDTVTGHWNEKEGWPLLIRTGTTGCLPLLKDTPSWLPVDQAAHAIVDIVLGDQSTSFIYHIVHPLGIDWSTVLDGLHSAAQSFERVQPSIWLQKVEASPEEDPSKQMLSIWKSSYETEAEAQPKVIVDTSNARHASVSFRNLEPVSEAHIRKMVDAWRRTCFLEPTPATR